QGGFTAVFTAASGGHNNCLHSLIAAGGDINLRAGNNCTPLTEAARLGHPSTVILLLKSGAQTYVQDGSGKTALDYARKSGDKAMIQAIEAARKNQKSRPSLFDQPIYGSTAKQFVKKLEAVTAKLPEKQAEALNAAIQSDLANFDAHIKKRITQQKSAAQISGPLNEKQKRILTGIAENLNRVPSRESRLEAAPTGAASRPLE
ncbi:MAG: ankyrin repeat domain-containing protein, partial [Acidobacteriota bacterium]